MGRGKLKFKGEEKAKKKKKRDKSSLGGDASSEVVIGGVAATASVGGSDSQQQHIGDSTAASAGTDSQVKDAPEIQSPKITTGQGLITTSSTVVSGHGTAFKTQLRVGDAIIAGNEMRVITMVLSRISISISSAFSTDLKSPTPYNYINKPRNDQKERAAKAHKAHLEKEKVEARAMGTYGNKGEIVYREKTVNGGYRIRKEQATTDMSRSDLLSHRAKKKSDRYC